MAESKKSAYRILFTKSAQRDYAGIRDTKLIRGINRIIDKLKENPFQFKKLSGPLAHLRTAKTFSFRILFQIQNEDLIVLVVSVEARKDAYR